MGLENNKKLKVCGIATITLLLVVMVINFVWFPYQKHEAYKYISDNYCTGIPQTQEVKNVCFYKGTTKVTRYLLGIGAHIYGSTGIICAKASIDTISLPGGKDLIFHAVNSAGPINEGISC